MPGWDQKTQYRGRGKTSKIVIGRSQKLGRKKGRKRDIQPCGGERGWGEDEDNGYPSINILKEGGSSLTRTLKGKR